jgi:hypothetical protein
MTVIKRKRIGGTLVQYCQSDEGTFYVEAESDEFRVWRMTRDELLSKEIYQRFRFWVWFIEAIPSRTFLRLATWLMKL